MTNSAIGNSTEENPTTDAQKKARWLKTARVIYWVITGFFAVTMIMAGVMYIIGYPPVVAGFMKIGYPIYVMKILGVFKVLGGTVFLFVRSRTIKEWAYAGYTFNLVGAIVSHAFTDQAYVPAAIVLILVLISYRQWKTGWM
jgi:hypothetical protein